MRNNPPSGWIRGEWTASKLPNRFVGGVHGIAKGNYLETFQSVLDESMFSNVIAYTNQYSIENNIQYNGAILKVTKEDIMKYFGGFNYNGIKSRN
jgi:hypothetical protein